MTATIPTQKEQTQRKQRENICGYLGSHAGIYNRVGLLGVLETHKICTVFFLLVLDMEEDVDIL